MNVNLQKQPFNRDEVLSTEDRDITIFMQTDQGIIGGMTYRLDPDLEIYTI
tara:strand:- start:638 stop:790 length:153 start_codon:yes stop_codon:yes gene_type:complete